MLLRSEFLMKRSPANQVHIFTDELLPLYNRPYLIDYPGGEVGLEPLVVCPEDWYRGSKFREPFASLKGHRGLSKKRKRLFTGRHR